ncbi:hypothetical protein T484DRAFT_1883910 [Baffinella frigidus]|nr:hypothetical protein T484DRAFT_1883910 [Cryptophyta sp. CCMP2293]
MEGGASSCRAGVGRADGRMGRVMRFAALAVLAGVLLALVAPADGQVPVVVNPPEIILLVADDPTNADSVYGNGDTITITFDVNTDMAGLAEGVDQTQNTVDRLFFFRQGLGSNYRGKWTSLKVFVVTILDWPGAAPPVVGPAGLQRAIRADLDTVGLSASSASVSPRLTGDFGFQEVTISSITASDPTPNDDVFSVGDKITINFNVLTNRAVGA